jgi:hypothetical protein
MSSPVIRLTVLAALPLLPACGSIISGTTQQIMVNTNPPGAECGLFRQGNRIATVQSTPGSALVDKTKHDITILCVKPGFEQASFFNKSGVEGATLGNIILGGGIGWAIDSASGADNKYQSPVNVTMVPLAPGADQTASVLPSTIPPPPAAQSPRQ